MASLWSIWIIVLTVITLVGLTWVLFANRKMRNQDPEAKTGHDYDGIEEYDNPLPAWWFFMFLITIVWGVGYLIAYPGLGNFPGLLKWTQLDQYQEQVDKAEEKYRAMRDRYLALPVEEIAGDPAVRKMGMRLFGNNCAQCHGADGRGSYGFPNLTDDDWIYGGTPDAIKTSITQGRRAAMPPWGDILGDQGVSDVVAHVLTLNGREADPEAAARGAKQFQTYCMACHGPDGTGNPMLGAPNLTNGVWLYGGKEDQIAHTVRSGRNGVMPSHETLLSEDKIHIISAYVYGLSRQ